MIVQSVELENFRNYKELKLEFHEGINIFYGDNAQGKTNILEAVYLCCTNKSHRSSRDREMIRFEAEEAHIKMLLNRQDSPYRIDMHLKKNKAKGIAVNGIPYGGPASFLVLPMWCFFLRRICRSSKRVHREEENLLIWNCVSWIKSMYTTW